MTLRHMLLFVLAAVLVGCAQPAEQSAPDTEADRAAIEEVRSQELAAINSADAPMEYASDGFVAMPPDGPALTGADEMRGWMEGLRSQFEISATYPAMNVLISGDIAVEPYTGTLTLTPVDGGDAIEETFKGIHVYQRQADGSWKMTHDVWNSDGAPAME